MDIELRVDVVPNCNEVIAVLVFDTKPWEEENFYRYSDNYCCVQTYTGDQVALLKQNQTVVSEETALIKNPLKILRHAKPCRFVFNELLQINDDCEFKLKVLEAMSIQDIKDIDLICSILRCLKESHGKPANI